MSLLDDFIEQNRPGRGGDLPDPAQDNAFRVNIGEGYIPASLGINKSGIFWLDKVDFTISSRILALSVANSILFIVFEGGKLLRINLQKANDITEIEIPLAKGDSLGQPKLYVDPTARHVLISTPQGANFYRLEGWAKAKPLNKFKGMFITALAWNRSLMAVSGASTSTYPILLGTHSGEVWEAELQASDELFKSDIKYFHKVYELPLQERVLGLHAEPFPVDPKTYFVIMTTQTRIYQFVSQVDLFTGGSDQSLFRQLFKNNAMNPNYQEIPGEGGAGTLYLYTKSRGLDIQAASSAIVWLTSMGIYYGELVYGSQKPGGSVVKGASLLPYPDDDGGAEASELPISAALTEFHIILLYKGRLKAICILNNVAIYEEAIPMADAGATNALVTDPIEQTYWVYNPFALYEVGIADEDRDVWRIYLQRNQFDLATKYAHDSAERDLVLRAQANYCFSNKQYNQSADYFAQSTMSFEETVLKFVQIHNNEALQRYLEAKLETLSNKERMQISLIATWLVEINLVILNSLDNSIMTAKLEEGKDHLVRNYEAEREVAEDSFKEFLGKYRKYLDKRVVFQLIQSHGCQDIMLYYADLLGDYKLIIDYWLSVGDYKQALTVLGKHVTPAYIYEYSVVFIQHCPEELINILMRQPDIEPRRLVPAFVKYEQTVANRSKRNQVIRYLMFCVQERGNRDPVVHNYLFTALAKQGGVDAEQALLTYVESQGQEMVCSLDYALRVCRKYNRIHTCVYLFNTLGHYEDAVDLALECSDLELAQQSADKPENADLKRCLWLKIAKHVIEKQNDLKLARDITRTSKVLAIEDILPYFPDFTQIDDFKDDICQALEDYEEQQRKLRLEMEESVQASQMIQADMQGLRNRFAILAIDETCQHCDQPLFLSQSSVFPCGHAFHTECLTLQVSISSNRVQSRRIRELQDTIKELARQQRKLKLLQAGGAVRSRKQELESLFAKLKKARANLHDIVAKECILCGEVMIKSVAEGFIDYDQETDEMATWAI